MDSKVSILITYVIGDELRTLATKLDVNTDLGQLYLYWKEDIVAKQYKKLFAKAEISYDFIVKVETINNII
jgi:hypothetical protein